VLQIISWSASRLHHLETVVNSTSRHLPSASKSSNSPSKLSSNGEAEQGIREKRTGQPMDKILHALTQLPISSIYYEDISTDSLRQIATTLYSVHSFTASSPLQQTNGALGIDVGQRNAYFRRFIAVGGALFQTQLSCLIDILEQSLYLLWRHLSIHLNKQSLFALESCAVGSGTIGIKPDFLEHSLLLSTNRLSDTVAPSPLQKDRIKMAEADLQTLASVLPRRLNFDLLDSISQVSKAPYIGSSDQLFLEVMIQKLDRVNQVALKISNSSKR